MALALADMPGAMGASMNLPAGAAGATTLESRTNLLGLAKEGGTVLGHCAPIPIGRRRSVWQARITSEAGKTVALVTQGQMVL